MTDDDQDGSSNTTKQVNDNKKDDEKNIENEKKAALLTLKSQSDPYYDKYTIYPVYNKQKNETDTKLYQMLKVYDSPIDFKVTDLDYKCFPKLYPYGNINMIVKENVK